MKLHFNIFIYTCTYTYFDLSDVIEKARVNLKKIYNIRHEFNNLIKIHDNIVLHLFFKKKNTHQILNKRAPCIMGHKRKVFT